MNQTLHRIYSLFVLCFIVCFSAYTARAQWEVMERPEYDWGAVQALASVRSGSNNAVVLMGTPEGIFADRTGTGIHGRWIDISAGIPPGLRDIRSIAVVDSLVFVASANGGVFAAVINRRTTDENSIVWNPISTNILASSFNTLLVQDTTLFLGTDNGVWAMRLSKLSSGLNRKKLVFWSRVDDEFRYDVLSLYARNGALYAGTRTRGTFQYDLNALQLTTWTQMPTARRADESSVLSISYINQDLSIESQTRAIKVPCNGLVVSSGSREKLLLGTLKNPETKSMEWLDISPARYQALFQSNINTILTGDFPGVPHAIFVGTESRGVLFSDDCGNSWFEFNDGVNTTLDLKNTSIHALQANENLLLAGVTYGNMYNNDAVKGGRIASITSKNLTRAVIQDASQRIADTTHKDNRVQVTSDVGSERGTVQVSLGDTQYIEVFAYSLLGKKVMDIYTGEAKTGTNNLPFDISQLSNGMYICVVRGKTFKLAEKFLVSR